MSKPVCLLCGNSGSLYAELSPGIFTKQYSILVCDSCGIGFTEPRPSADISHYSEASREPVDEALFQQRTNRTIRKITQVYTKTYGKAPKSFLDVGCGYGLTIKAARLSGLVADGIEPSAVMAKYAARDGAAIFHGSLFEFPDYDKYDLILLESVLEHIEDAGFLIKFLCENSKPDALIVFGQALYDGLVAKQLKRFWYGWSPEEHFWHFTDSAFQKLLERHGFEVVAMSRSSLIHQFYFGKNIRRFIFNNGKAVINLFAQILKSGDHGLFFVRKFEHKSADISHR